MSLSFPIPDWGEEVFKYPGIDIKGETNVKKKPNNRKRKHDGDGTLEKDQPANSQARQQAFKKKKTIMINTGPEKKKVNGIKEPSRNGSKNTKNDQGKTNTTELFSHQEDNQNHSSEIQIEADTKSPMKQKKKRKNNKYKELNIRQKEDKLAQADSGDTTESKQKDIMKIGKSKEASQANTSNEEAQSSQTKEVKRKRKKKKKSKLLEHTHKNVPEEDNTDNEKNSTDTSHQNTMQDVEPVNSHGSKINSHHSLANNVNVKKKKNKKSINTPSDTILSSGVEAQSCLESNSHQHVSNEKVENINKVKSAKSDEENIEEKNGIESSLPVDKYEKVIAEDGTKKKKKKKEKIQENSDLLKVKDCVSNSKKAKLKKQKIGEKSSKKVKENEEELVFDSDEECSEEFKNDLGALLSSLNFSRFKTPDLGQEMSNDDDDGDDDDLKGSNRQEMLDIKNCEDSAEWGSEDKEKSKDLNERKKMKSAKTNRKKLNSGKNLDASQELTTSVKKGDRFNREKVAKLLEEAASIQREKPKFPSSPADTLKQRMEGRLMAAKFRMVNQELYTKSSTEATQLFKRDPAAFDAYHQGYQAQVRQWPVNPLDLIIKWLSKKPREWVVADMGCGEAALAQRVPQSCVHSLDLVAANPQVTACDMAHTPLTPTSVDVVVFCLSLMGNNLKDFLVESNRVLRVGGIMKIAEVESRFEDVKEFEKHLTKYGFHCTSRDTSYKYFFLLEFKKKQKIKKTATFPDIFLKPCLYKKR